MTARAVVAVLALAAVACGACGGVVDGGAPSSDPDPNTVAAPPTVRDDGGAVVVRDGGADGAADGGGDADADAAPVTDAGDGFNGSCAWGTSQVAQCYDYFGFGPSVRADTCAHPVAATWSAAPCATDGHGGGCRVAYADGRVRVEWFYPDGNPETTPEERAAEVAEARERCALQGGAFIEPGDA